MSVTVNVVGQTSVSVSVASQSAASVSVAASTGVSVVASGGIGPAGFITVPGTATSAFGTFQIVPGEGITVSTANGQFLISSYPSTALSSFAPVQSVSGRTGTVVLQASDVTAGTFAIGRIPTIGYTALSGVPTAFSPAIHTHDAAEISSGTLSIARVPTISYTALSNTPSTFSPAAHTHSTSDVSGLAAVATSGSYTSLQNVPATFSPQAHTHSTADITGFTGSFAAGNHTHDAAAITSGVLDLARIPTIGYTALSGVPATFAPQAHTHSTADVVGLTASFSQSGHAHEYVRVLNGLTGTVTIAGGAGVTVSTASSSITISAGGGGGGSANIIEADTASGFPATGASQAIYVSRDSSRVYRWDASGVYVEIGTGSGVPVSAAPDSPTGLVATRGDSNVTLSWTAPASNGGSAITDYAVQYALQGTTNWQTYADGTSTATAATLSLPTVYSYQLRVSAVNAVGTSSPATLAGTVLVGPSGLSGSTSGSGSLNASWTGVGDTASHLRLVNAYYDSNVGGIKAVVTALRSGTMEYFYTSTGSAGRSVVVQKNNSNISTSFENTANTSVTAGDLVAFMFFPAAAGDRITIDAYLST
jgi:hypothetical protein